MMTIRLSLSHAERSKLLEVLDMAVDDEKDTISDDPGALNDREQIHGYWALTSLQTKVSEAMGAAPRQSVPKGAANTAVGVDHTLSETSTPPPLTDEQLAETTRRLTMVKIRGLELKIDELGRELKGVRRWMDSTDMRENARYSELCALVGDVRAVRGELGETQVILGDTRAKVKDLAELMTLHVRAFRRTMVGMRGKISGLQGDFELHVGGGDVKH